MRVKLTFEDDTTKVFSKAEPDFLATVKSIIAEEFIWECRSDTGHPTRTYLGHKDIIKIEIFLKS